MISGIDLLLVALANLHTTLAELPTGAFLGPFRGDHLDRLEYCATDRAFGPFHGSGLGCFVGK